MPRKKPPSDYEVGYAKPPIHTRFRAGQSGNPKGRAKGARDVKTTMEEALKREFSQKVRVVEGGQPRLLTKLELIATTHVNKAAKGDARALREIVILAQRLGLLEGPPPSAAETEVGRPFCAEEQAIVERFLARERMGAPAAIADPAPGPDHTVDEEDDAA